MIITATLWNTKGWSFSVRYHINIVAKKFKFKTHKTSPSKVFSQIWKKKIKKNTPWIFFTKFECKRLVINFKRALFVVIAFKFPLI